MKLKKLLCLVLTLAMVASSFAALTITTTAATSAVSISYDLAGLCAKNCASKVALSRTYKEFKTGDDASVLGAYSAHNMVFDGGTGSTSMTYLSPNPLSYWTNTYDQNLDKGVAIDYGGMGYRGIDSADLSYVMYKVKSDSAITSLMVKLYGCLAPSLDQNGNGGWAQMAVYAFASNPADLNGKINFAPYQDPLASNCIGDMHGVHDFYNTPEIFDLTESAIQAGFPTEMYVVVACLASGHILERIDDRLSGFGGQGGAPVFRLSGIDILTNDDGPVNNIVYVRESGNDSNDGKTEATAVKTVAKANELAAAMAPSRAIVNIPTDMLQLGAANNHGSATLTVSNATVKQYFPGVAFWGDSLTAGVSTTGYDGKSAWNPYSLVFGDLVKNNLISDFAAINRANFGIGGENFATIVARSNGIPATVASSISIPASGTTSAFTIKLQGYNDAVTPLVQGSSIYTGDVSKVSINGISGKLALSGGQYTFTRDSAGSATTVAAGTQIVFTAGNQFDNTNYIPVVFGGYNDGADNVANNTDKYIKYVDAILNKYPQAKNNGRYVVITPHFKKDKVDAAKKVEAAFAAKYGDHLIKTREFMSTYGPYEMGIYPDATDFQMMARGQVPNCLMSTDDTHYSASGFTLIAKLIFQKMFDLGYFNEIAAAGNIDLTKWGPVAPTPIDPIDPIDPVDPIITTNGDFVKHEDTAKLSVNVNYDEFTHKNGKRSVESVVKENKYVMLDNTNCTTYGAYIAHNLFIDGKSGGSVGGSMTYIHPGNYDAYDGAYAELGNAIEADFTDLSTINASYDFSYIGYKISAGKGKVLDTLNVNLYGALWPSVLTGAKNDCRFQMAVYVTNKNPDPDTGRFNFSDKDAICVFAKGDKSQYPDAYGESDCYKINCSSAIAQLCEGHDGKGESDIYVIVVLSCVGWGVGESEDRLSPYQTTNSLRYTGIKIDATAKTGEAFEHDGPNPPPTTCTHTNSTLVPAKDAGCTVPGNTAYYKCNDCGKLFSDSACQNEITLESTVIPAGHKNTYIGVEAGHVAVCSECGTQGTLEPHTFNGQNVCTVCEYVGTPACQHTSVASFAAKAATCKEAGNTAYYKCNSCNKYFSDITCRNEITLDSTVIPKSSTHSYGNKYSSDAQGHWQTCSVCGTTTQVTDHTPNIDKATATQDKYCTTCNYVIEKATGGQTTVKPGDVNGDNRVTAKDAKYLLGYNSFPSKYPINAEQNVDYNNDGWEDADDVDYLLMYLFMPSQYPLYPVK